MGPDYPKAAANTRPVGLFTGDFVNFLISQGVDLGKLHLIGFSMGAHIVGRAGRIANGVLPRITGSKKYLSNIHMNPYKLKSNLIRFGSSLPSL